MAVRLSARQWCGFGIGQKFVGTGIGDEMDLDIMIGSFGFVDELVGVSTEAIDVPNSGGQAAIAEEEHPKHGLTLAR